MKMEVISKEKALEINQKWYFTNIKCKNGHIAKRYVNTGICYDCKQNQMKRDYEFHKERVTSTNNKSVKKNYTKVLERNKKWNNDNIEKSRLIKRAYYYRYHEVNKEKAKVYCKNKRSNYFNRISNNLQKDIWLYFKTGKKTNTNILLFDLNFDSLKSHFESKFDDNMNWDNYGTYWHIDHIRPLSSFNLETELLEAWSINNLQPLKAIDNLIKSNKYEKL